MKTQPNLAIRVAVAALALSACGVAVGISGGTSASAASVWSARHAPGDTGAADLREMAQVKRDVGRQAAERARAQMDTSWFADLKDMAQVKRDVAWRAVERARAHAGTRGVLGGGRLARSSDCGLAGCASLSGAHQIATRDYPKIAARFASSRWPDLRISGLAYVEIATKLRSTHAYGGETVWFYQRLSAACAKHGRPLAF
jgi:hypothetical protein